MPRTHILRGLQRPIIQAPVGGCAGPDLVAAVSAAGGLGILPCTWWSPDTIRAHVAAVRAATPHPFGANLVLAFDIATQLDAVLAAGVRLVTFSWGQPGAARIARCHAAGAAVAVQIGAARAADEALRDGADVLIAQGFEAGGHVQSTTPLRRLLDAVLARAPGAPVVATGGLATRSDVEAALAAGASAAMLGTRFVASAESTAHPDYKQALVTARAEDSVYTICFDGDWPFAAHRALRNATLDDWEAAGCPPPGRRPREADVVARAAGGDLVRYSSDAPHRGHVGWITEACLYAGTGVDRIEDVASAGEIVARLDPTTPETGRSVY